MTPQKALDMVDTINLSNVKRKLLEEQSWEPAMLESVERLYRKFLALMLLDPDGSHVPTGPVDRLWHVHILDTVAYAADCERVFGRFVHHNPYLGLGYGSGGSEELDASFNATMAKLRGYFEIDASDPAVTLKGINCCAINPLPPRED